MSRRNGRTWTEFSRMSFICGANEMKPVANEIDAKHTYEWALSDGNRDIIMDFILLFIGNGRNISIFFITRLVSRFISRYKMSMH